MFLAVRKLNMSGIDRFSFSRFGDDRKIVSNLPVIYLDLSSRVTRKFVLVGIN